MKKFLVNCKNCKSTEIQTTMEADSGYSNYTVMESGFVEFKCIGCGKFGSTDEYKDKPANDLKNFEVRCKVCGSEDWCGNIQDVDHEDEKTNVECRKCGEKEFDTLP